MKEQWEMFANDILEDSMVVQMVKVKFGMCGGKEALQLVSRTIQTEDIRTRIRVLRGKLHEE